MAFINKYARIPVVEAVQYNGRNGHLFKMWTDGEILESPVLEPDEDNPSGRYLQMAPGVPSAIPGDWVVKENGKYKVVSDEYFKKTFEIIT